jgi:raffinose/stachyose/melibiose transport system substrate-binding protein
MGLMPIPQNTDDGTNTKLVAGSTKYLFIDNSDSISDKERQAAKDFLNWLVYDKAGQQLITKTCGLVSPFTNNSVDAADPLGKSLAQYLKDDKLISWYNFLPDDQQATVGAMTQQYLGKKTDRAQFAGQIESYWKNARLSTSR